MMKKQLLSGFMALLLLAGIVSGCAAPAADGAQTGDIIDLGGLIDESVPLTGAPPISTVIMPVASGSATKAENSATIDYSNAKDGYVMVKWSGGGSPKLKVLITGPNTKEQYQYNLSADGSYNTFPLSDGNGSYSIGVYKQASGTQYTVVTTCTVSVQLSDEFAPFLRPNQYVNFNENSTAVAKAAELCKSCTTNLEKVEAVYNYVVNSLTYDTNKAATVQKGYVPNVDSVLAAGTGICFDYAALMSAMLRSQGVPIKLVVGYVGGSTYHAWINCWDENGGWVDEVIYFDGKEWKLMDPTFASSGKQSKRIMEYIGDGKNYKARFLY